MRRMKICSYFLWKDEEIIGLIGTEIFAEWIEIQHVSVNPSFRQQGIGKSMVRALKELYPDKEIKANEYTAAFLTKCETVEAEINIKHRIEIEGDVCQPLFFSARIFIWRARS